MSKTKKNIHSSEGYSSTTCSSSSPSSDEEIDARDLKPIKDYMGDRRELAQQLFKSVKAEKVRMMLPQTLKKVDFSELEELCASELSGMSKARILSILNGKPMLESSDTSESDDSGPSLEIISDTEEWLTDDDAPKKTDGKPQALGKAKIKKERKVKAKTHAEKKNSIDKSKIKPKNSMKEDSDRIKETRIKKEGEKEVHKDKEKEGDSLLDLLELEMRARAIRALIRNEEDIIPEQSAKVQANKNPPKDKAVQEEIKAKENCRRQLEKIITSKTSAGEDEDVVLVVQPTPTIELLSSESDEEGHGRRINQKLQNERVTEAQRDAKYSSPQQTHADTVAGNSLAAKDKDGNACPQTSKDRNDDSRSSNVDNSKTPSDKRDDNPEKKRKLKRKFHSKEPDKLATETVSKISSSPASESQPKHQEARNSNEEASASSNVGTETDESKKEQTFENATVEKNESTSVTEPSDASASNTTKKFIVDDDRSADMDEIIDLDDYSDDMEDLECDDSNKRKLNASSNKSVEGNKSKLQTKVVMQKSNSTETWATRYYQTDDVQNVIKESKIQSEIRKRLRERQRLSKMSKSPNVKLTSASSSPVVEKSTPEQKPTGSVEEYLALKRNLSGNSGTDSNEGNVSEMGSSVPANSGSDAPNVEVDKTSAKEAESRSGITNPIEATGSTNTDMRPD